LRPYPSEIAREHVFGDRTRSDVLLLDRDDNLVVVECKQHGPTVADIAQLRGYMAKAGKLAPGKLVRGILVHGGARKVSEGALSKSRAEPAVELVQFEVHVGFARSN
jgi:RecB family endonuclease NucS